MKQRIAKMQQFLTGQTEEIEKYDESLVRRMVEKITVYEDKFTVEFKSDMSVNVDKKEIILISPLQKCRVLCL
ncbi:MAG: hypothetical protein RSE60_01195 [Erysipelotrichaceae bacterium]